MSKRYPGGIIRKTPQTPSQTSAQGIWDMASVTQAVKENTWPIAGVPDPISKSLRFRSSASAYLNRTPTSAGNQQKWTFSAWIKRGKLSTDTLFWSCSSGSNSNKNELRFNSSDQWSLETIVSGSSSNVTTTQVFRDPSAWYHLVLACDTTQATASNRLRFYVNGVEVTAFSSSSYPSQNQNLYYNSTNKHLLAAGNEFAGQVYSDLYVAEFYWVDGQQLTPSSFGSTNDQTGVWQPIAYTGTYGTNGFYLPFSNTASTTTLGYDFSGNSNNWTTNNISLTSGSTYDSMVDVPTQWIPYNTAGDTGALFRGNYAVMNPLDNYATTITNGNLQLTGSSSAWNTTRSTFAMPSGSWYCELTSTSGTGNGNSFVGIAPQSTPLSSISNSTFVGGTSTSWAYSSNGNTYTNGSVLSSTGTTWASGSVIGISFTGSELKFYKNNTLVTTISSISTDSYCITTSFYSSDAGAINFGQRPFAYTPPAGFKTLCTTNLSTPTIGATASTTANKYFDATLYTGNGTSQSITNVNFAPDFTWIKDRTLAWNNKLFDTIRGAGKYLISDNTAAEATDTSQLSAFLSNGFSVGSQVSVNGSGDAYVSWNWNAGGSTVTNTSGSITSQVRANTTAGFSIVTYTGNGTIGATIGHGLGVAPSMLIVKQRTGGLESWQVYHSVLGATQYLQLNSTGAAASNINRWNNTAPTSTVFTVYNDTINNGNTNTYVAYCFAQVAGYSAFGSYTGNGSSDGTFVYTGFRPAFVMVKGYTGTSSDTTRWLMLDDARNPYNAVDAWLYANLSNAEATLPYIDFLSNGFKFRDNNLHINQSGISYIYMAFAESPFKYALAR